MFFSKEECQEVCVKSMAEGKCSINMMEFEQGKSKITKGVMCMPKQILSSLVLGYKHGECLWHVSTWQSVSNQYSGQIKEIKLPNVAHANITPKFHLLHTFKCKQDNILVILHRNCATQKKRKKEERLGCKNEGGTWARLDPGYAFLVLIPSMIPCLWAFMLTQRRYKERWPTYYWSALTTAPSVV